MKLGMTVDNLNSNAKKSVLLAGRLATITYMPYKEIVLHEVREVTVQELLESVISQVEAQKLAGVPVLRWVDGVMFAIGEFPLTPETVGEMLQGKIHYASVSFARTSYQPEKRVTWNGRDHVVKLLKADNNPDMINLSKFLQDFKQQTMRQDFSAAH